MWKNSCVKLKEKKEKWAHNQAFHRGKMESRADEATGQCEGFFPLAMFL